MTDNAVIEKKDSRNREVMNPFRAIKKMIKFPHYCVPPCPRCGCTRTGRFIKFHSVNDDDYINAASLKNGEIIKFVPDVDPDHNLFCTKCGLKWSENVPVRWFTIEEIERVRRMTGCEEELTDLMAEQHEEKKHEKHGFFHLCARFVGKF